MRPGREFLSLWHMQQRTSTTKPQLCSSNNNNNNNNNNEYQSHLENILTTYQENMDSRNYRKQAYWALHTYFGKY